MRGKRKPGRPKKTWKWQVEKESESVGLEKKDAMNRARSIEGVREIAARVSPHPPTPPFMWIKIGFMMMMMKVQMTRTSTWRHTSKNIYAGVPGEKPYVTSDKLPDSHSKFPCIHL